MTYGLAEQHFHSYEYAKRRFLDILKRRIVFSTWNTNAARKMRHRLDVAVGLIGRYKKPVQTKRASVVNIRSRNKHERIMAPRKNNRRRGRRSGRITLGRWFEYHTVTLTTGASSWVARANLYRRIESSRSSAPATVLWRTVRLYAKCAVTDRLHYIYM